MDAAMLSADTMARTEKSRILRGYCVGEPLPEVYRPDYCPATLAT